jgi:hypothetical protein
MMVYEKRQPRGILGPTGEEVSGVGENYIMKSFIM